MAAMQQNPVSLGRSARSALAVTQYLRRTAARAPPDLLHLLSDARRKGRGKIVCFELRDPLSRAFDPVRGRVPAARRFELRSAAPARSIRQCSRLASLTGSAYRGLTRTSTVYDGRPSAPICAPGRDLCVFLRFASRQQSSEYVVKLEPQTAIDLFAGVGGLSAGLRSAGFDVRAAVEIDPVASSTYLKNHPKTDVIVDDIRNVSGEALLRAAGLEHGQLALLTGCPPCQGYSTLRTRRKTKAVKDPRNDLIFEFLRLVQSVRPRAVLLENVPGLAADTRFQKFCRALKLQGYSVDFATIDAQHYGVPQRRKRLVLLAMLNQSLPDNWSKSTSMVPVTVRDAIGALSVPGRSGDALHDASERRSEMTMRRIRATPADGGSRDSLDTSLQLKCHAKSDGFSDVYGRMKWDAPAPTITSGCNNPSKGRFLHPTEHRAITLREAALLQTFPPRYKFDLTRGKEHVAAQIGNAFPPRMILPIARRIRRALSIACLDTQK